MESLYHTVQYVSDNLKIKIIYQVEVIELFLAKLATLRILSNGLKNFPIQLIKSSIRFILQGFCDILSL